MPALLLAALLGWAGATRAADPMPALLDRFDPGSRVEPTAAEVVGGAHDSKFVAQTYAAILPARDNRVWYRVRLQQDWPFTLPPVLSIADPQGLAVTLYAPPAYTGAPHSIYANDSEPGFSRHALAIVLPGALKAGMPIYLEVAPARALSHGLRIDDMTAAHVRDLAQARFDIAFPAIQLASVLVMLAFFLALRERMYAYFVGHVLFLLLYELYEFGIGFEFAPFDLLTPLRERSTWLLGATSAIFLCLFSRHFLALEANAPRLDRLLKLIAWPLGFLGLCALVPAFSSDGWIVEALLLSILTLASLLLVAAMLTWHRRSWRGGVYLCAWLPGLMIVIVRSVQLIAHWPQPAWLELALPAGFAFASIVLAFGLAEHMLAVRHERDVAHRLAEHDMLTGVLNRRAIQSAARAAFRNARNAGTPLALLFLDIDHFKKVNDSHGHRVGDHCLRAIIAPIAGELRHEDALGRYGGEEFLIVLPGIEAPEACAIAERIRLRAQRAPVHVSGIRIDLTVSVGIAVIDAQAANVEELIERADSALYRAKSEGRNQVRAEAGDTDAIGHHAI